MCKEIKTIPNTAIAIMAASLCVSCDKNSSEPILRGGYETAKVSVTGTHVPTASGGGGVLDTDQGVSERELWGESGSGQTAERYTVSDVTSTEFYAGIHNDYRESNRFNAVSVRWQDYRALCRDRDRADNRRRHDHRFRQQNMKKFSKSEQAKPRKPSDQVGLSTGAPIL